MNYADITLRIAGVVQDSIVDGPGLRFTLFVQGCPHRCPGCHNPQTHDPAGGYDCLLQKILDAVDKNPLVSGVTLSGGEPFSQPEPLAVLAGALRQRGKNIIVYSGYTFEELLSRAEREPAVIELLSRCDYLVDGRFILAQKNLLLRWRGSDNQRIVYLPDSLREKRAVTREDMTFSDDRTDVEM